MWASDRRRRLDTANSSHACVRASKETNVRRAFRKGFPLIELMVVIGIILLLVSITVFGLRHVNAVAARKETFAEMEICRNMLKEYQSVNGLTNIEGNSFTVPKITVPNTINPAATVDVLEPIYKDSNSS